MEQAHQKNIAALFMDARDIGLRANSFDVVLSGFMGWYDCFDFQTNEFTQPDKKATEIFRIIRQGGRLFCCSWEAQEDLAWMEQAMLRHYPQLLADPEYLEERPIGMAYEKPAGYEIILGTAGFQDIQVAREVVEVVSTDEDEWWQQMSTVGWRSFFGKIAQAEADPLQRIKEAIFRELQAYKHSDGIHFTKSVFFMSGVK